MKMLKRKGPRTLPCGTPLVIEHVEEMDEPTWTAWVLWVRNTFIHNKRLPDIPYASSLCSSLLCEIESKVLWKSTYAIVTDLWLASVMVQLLRDSIRFVVVECRLRKPCWALVINEWLLAEKSNELIRNNRFQNFKTCARECYGTVVWWWWR